MTNEYTFLWGTGNVAKYICKHFSDELKRLDIYGFIDNRQIDGENFYGYPVYNPKVLSDLKNVRIIVLTEQYIAVKKQIDDCYSENVSECLKYHYFIRLRLIDRYRDSDDIEIIKILEQLKDYSLDIFNYEFVKNYRDMDVELFFDENHKLYYTIYEGKRMYFARCFSSEEEIREYYKGIMLEQDLNSPHRYLTDGYDVDEDSIVIDAGVAEGNFSLSIIDKVKKIYLIEPDEDWIEALRITFEQYKEKVVFVNKYISNYDSGETVKLDSIVEEKQINYIKMDIEGEELYALQGAENILDRAENIKCNICSYHQESDYREIERFLVEKGYEVSPSKGYMWFPFDKNYLYSLPTLRRGLIRGIKKQ